MPCRATGYGIKLNNMTAELKKELVEYVLLKSPVWLLNEAIKSFSTQRLYSRYKRDLMSDYADLMPCELKYAVVMSEVFSDYHCDEALCKELRSKIDLLKYKVKLYKKAYPVQYSAAVDEHNATVELYSKLIAPQNKLIKLYKSIQTKVVN